ncbi:2TM domain-containing protein [Tenacibaculum sp. M341]|uniref:2TM domain-containing protein n=1 Tax=Tenacibaculum sp. M341 TaxID=2530339 RepID=UPI0010431576|nr:2TM domain-containing protein [Tenacibaculum sp. M341]TCI90565.1 2TM domain-containing protein [Tenacibaculum sp. M341]
MNYIQDTYEESQYVRATRRVEELKKFYKHLAVYLVINIFISTNKIIRNLGNGESFEEAFFDFNTFAVWFFWGIAIVLQAFKLFGFNFFLGKNWEERKIQEMMQKNKQQRNNVKF